MMNRKVVSPEIIKNTLNPINPLKRNLSMKGGRWVKCVKTITEIFIEGKYYQIHYRYDTYITLIDELGNGIGFDTIRDQVFKDHFKLRISQKRGTEWATRRQQ